MGFEAVNQFLDTSFKEFYNLDKYYYLASVANN